MAKQSLQWQFPLFACRTRRAWRTRSILVLLALLGACATPSQKELPKPVTPPPKAAVNPEPVGPLPVADRVIVEKRKRRLTLLHHGEPIRVFTISLGSHPVGPKVAEGDGRTPEGTYTLDWRNPKSKYFLAFHVSYPNRQDIARARKMGVPPGGQIMVHGYGKLPSGMTTLKGIDWTNGCIALSNKEMAEIWRIVPSGTPIEIRP
jgi:hypothetical protein